MAFLIPDNLKSRSDESTAVKKVASALQTALDEDVTVWFEPLFRPGGSHFVVIDPRLGVLVLQLPSLEQNVKEFGIRLHFEC